MQSLLMRRPAEASAALFSPLPPPMREGKAARDRRPPTIALLARDFDAPDTQDAAGAPDPEAEAAAALAAACAAARAEGEAAGEAAGRQAADAAQIASRAAAEAAALAAIAAALAGHEAAAERGVAEATEALARLLLGALDAALPAAAARQAPEIAAALIASIRPVLDAATRPVRLAVAPGFAEACAARIGDARIEVAEDPGLAPGDARAEWHRGGFATASLAARRGTVREVLAALGLAEEGKTPPGLIGHAGAPARIDIGEG